MLSFSKDQLADLRKLDETDFVARMQRQWPGYAAQFPVADLALTQEQVTELAHSAWRVADQHAFDDDMDRIRLTFYLWRAARIGKPLSYLRGLARFLVDWLPTSPAYAHEWIERRLYLAETELAKTPA